MEFSSQLVFLIGADPGLHPFLLKYLPHIFGQLEPNSEGGRTLLFERILHPNGGGGPRQVNQSEGPLPEVPISGKLAGGEWSQRDPRQCDMLEVEGAPEGGEDPARGPGGEAMGPGGGLLDAILRDHFSFVKFRQLGLKV